MKLIRAVERWMSVKKDRAAVDRVDKVWKRERTSFVEILGKKRQKGK